MSNPPVEEGEMATVASSDGASPMVPSSDTLVPVWLQQIIHDEGRLTLTDYEAGRLLGLSRGSVRVAIAEHQIQVVRLGRRLLIPLIPLLQLMGFDPNLESSKR